MKTIKVIAFDVLLLDGINMLSVAILERKQTLEKITFTSNDVLEVIDYMHINLANLERKKQIENKYNASRDKRNEGLMVKEWHKNAIYIPGTRKLWYKLKSFSDIYLDSLDLILVGAYKGEVF